MPRGMMAESNNKGNDGIEDFSKNNYWIEGTFIKLMDNHRIQLRGHRIEGTIIAELRGVIGARIQSIQLWGVINGELRISSPEKGFSMVQSSD
jgi:hypothetical protein